MKVKRYFALIVLLCSTAFAPAARADTYSTFRTTRYYSPGRRYFVVVTEKKVAALYRTGRRLRRVWSRALPELPQKLFVTGDGRRVAIVDRYYGNGGSPETPVVIVLDERGRQIAAHRLGDVTDLDRVVQTVSSAHWYTKAALSPDGETLVVETELAKRDWAACLKADPPPEEAEKCTETVPHQRLRFSLSSGELIERASLAPR